MSDERSLERQLARAVGDPGLRLLYQLAPGLPYVRRILGKLGLADTPQDNRRVLAVLAFLRV